MRLSIENLKRGIRWWQEGKWPADYLNHEYHTIYGDRADGLTEEWLKLTVDRLAKWRAIRSRKPPNTKATILASLKTKLPDIRKEYQRILDLSGGEPSIDTVSWDDLDPLYTMMADSKSRSPVFASKLGHFIFPRVFIVMDRLGTDVMPYDFYWQGMINKWSLFADRQTAIDLLRSEMRKQTSSDAHPYYPFGTKVLELCHIGSKRN